MGFKDEYIKRYADVNSVERWYGKKQETILCIIPSKLAEQTFATNIQFELNNFEQPNYGQFSINKFLNRYLAGSRSLRESRLLSRKRLALVTSQIGYIDPEAIDLVKQIDRYQQAREILTANHSLTLEQLLDINRSLEVENQRTGSLRQNQNWIGGKTPLQAAYVCPPPELVEELMHDWLMFINNPDLPGEITAIVGYSQLLLIHPFSDGNGRTSRVFLQSRLEQKYGDIIHPTLYRLHKNEQYIDAVQSTLRETSPLVPLHSFWQESLAWGNELKRRMYQILAEGQAELNARLAMRALSNNARTLLDYLWVQPIVCEAGLGKHFGWDFFTAHNAILELINVNILEAHKIRQPEGAIIYDCAIIFSTWQKLDDEIVQKVEASAA
ncbi:Fic family protein [Thalassomonas viridans]|uniref:Fic family protein n=1 Tax=Thalassomonas viridans TaxID=137584 RepID=A0AAE9Z670_9GAMM|nr:Fic family protein [Thalassomonas viridans]WDE05852.1 Fic family protein [Thalassomonas viridans]